VRHVKGSPTSLAAAIDNWPRAGTQKARILETLKAASDRANLGYYGETLGLTREELEQWVGLSGNAVRPRVAELIEAGLVKETDRKRKTRSGSEAYVLVATNARGSTEGRDQAEPGGTYQPVDATLGVASGVEASVPTSRPSGGTEGSARPNPYQVEVWAD